MGQLLLLVILLPLSELYLLIKIGELVGFFPTLAFVIGSGFAGFYFAKREGLRVWTEYQRALSEMRQPSDGVLEGLLVLVGGALLIVPGVLTDVVGLILLIPWSRRRVGKLVRRKLQPQMTTGVFTPPTPRAAEAPWKQSTAAVVETTGETQTDDSPELNRSND